MLLHISLRFRTKRETVYTMYPEIVQCNSYCCANCSILLFNLLALLL